MARLYCAAGHGLGSTPDGVVTALRLGSGIPCSGMSHARDRCCPACLRSVVRSRCANLRAALEGFDYGYPVKTFALESQRQPLEMAYLDVAPKKKPIGVVLLLHGKNFCAATWKETIKPLVAAGYR